MKTSSETRVVWFPEWRGVLVGDAILADGEKADYEAWLIR